MVLAKAKKILYRVDLMLVTAKSLSVLLAYLVGAYLTGHFHHESRYFGAMLACMAAIIVLQDDIKSTLHQSWLRILSTFIGSIFAVIYLSIYPFSVVGLIICTFILAVLCMLLNIPDNGRVSIMTLIIILFISKLTPEIKPVVNGLLRFIEAAVGSGIGTALAWEVYRIEGRWEFTKPRSKRAKK